MSSRMLLSILRSTRHVMDQPQAESLLDESVIERMVARMLEQKETELQEQFLEQLRKANEPTKQPAVPLPRPGGEDR